MVIDIEDMFAPSEPAEPKEDEFLGNKVITGKLTTTKGAQPMIDGIMLNLDFVREEGAKTWKPEFEKLKGKKVELKGDVWRHHCGPHEQCLQQGYIDSFRSLEYMKAL
ncbi:MAG: hypothetical protein AAF570_15785 [Bacteroidota bacterium]